MAQVLGIIPARGGSKGIPQKNIRELGGIPLIAHTIRCAQESGVVDRLVVSTDSEEIAAVARQHGAEAPFLRPAELAQDETAMLPVIQHAVGVLEAEGWTPDAIVLLQPTSPFRQPAHIQRALELLIEEEADSVVSVIEIPHIYAPQKALYEDEDGYLKLWIEGGPKITLRQQLRRSYAREGTIYVTRRDVLMEANSLYGAKWLPLVLDPAESLNLDTLEDWRRAEERIQAEDPQGPEGGR